MEKSCKIVQLDKFNQLIISEGDKYFYLMQISLNLRKVSQYRAEKLFFGNPRFSDLEDLVSSFVRFADGESCFEHIKSELISDFYRLSISETRESDGNGYVITTKYDLQREAIGAEKVAEAALKGERSEYNGGIFA